MEAGGEAGAGVVMLESALKGERKTSILRGLGQHF